MSIRLHQTRWPAADLAARVAQSDVVVCIASLHTYAHEVERSLALINSAEYARFTSYTNEIVARRFLGGRRMLREMLGSLLGVTPGEVPLREGLHGKPYLAAGTPGSVWFSVSHTDDLLVVAMSRTSDVGVDVERSRAFEQWQRVAGRVLDAQERRQLDLAVESGVDPGEAFLRHWCRVEAELKAVGCGIQGLDEHRAGKRPRGLRLTDISNLKLPADVLATGARYQAAVALCTPGSSYATVADSLRQASRDSAQDAMPTARPASASTP